MIPDYYDPRKVGELFLEDPAWIAKAAPTLPPPDEDRVEIAAFGHPARSAGPPRHSVVRSEGDDERSICAPQNRDRRRPGLAAAATQEGRAVAENILRDLRGEARRPFTYHDRGTMTTIGYRRAVGEFGARKLSGSLAWLLWSVVHMFLLIGFRSRVMVMGQWTWAYFTRTGSSPLITEYNPKRIEEDAGARLTLSRPDRDTPR